MHAIRESIRPAQQSFSREELISGPVEILLGVTPAAAELLGKFGIRKIFDLGMSGVFNSAKRLSEIMDGGDEPIARYMLVPGDLVDANVRDGLDDLASASPELLRQVGPNEARALREVLGITTLYELGHWHPFLVAHAIVHDALEAEAGLRDPGVPDELVPRFNEFPTEKFFYSIYAMDGGGDRDLRKLEPLLLEIDDKQEPPVLPVRTGAIIRYEQAWVPVGLALGNLLHSLALAPGETTRIAIIDWSRRMGVRTSEEMTQAETLSNSLLHTRSINEVTRAVAREAQTGFSQMNANSTVSNTAYSAYGVQNAEEAVASTLVGAAVGGAAGATLGGLAGFGVGALVDGAALLSTFGMGMVGGTVLGAGAGGLVGAASGGAAGFLSTAELGATSNSGSTTATEVVSTTSTTGARDIFGEMLQNIDDRTQQHASSSRSRKATIVQESWQRESENVTTRSVSNFNHMHALTIQYFEVVQMYSVRTRVAHVQRCLYVPTQPVKWSRGIVAKYRRALLASAVEPRVVNALLLESNTAVISPGWARDLPAAAAAAFAAEPRAMEALNRARWVLGTNVASFPLEPWHIRDDAVLTHVAVGLRRLRANGTFVFLSIGRLQNPEVPNQPVRNISAVAWRLTPSNPGVFDEDGDTRLDAELTFTHDGREFKWLYPVVITRAQLEGPNAQPLISVRFTRTPGEQWLLDHLRAHTDHYSRAVWRAVDETDTAALIAPYEHEGVALLDSVDLKPVAISGRYLIFAYHHAPEPEWSEWKSKRGYDAADHGSVELLPIATGGVFAEAVQGRANSAEKLDLTRFWNWQDSPIPLSAPEIAAVQAGSRATAADVRPGALAPPVVGITAPTALPDPQGMSAVMSALAAGNMFRDMSGLAEARQLAAGALQFAQAGATGAGTNATASLAKGMEMTSAAIQKILGMYGDLANSFVTAGFGALGAGTNISGTDASKAGAILNAAKDADAKARPGSTGTAIQNRGSSAPEGSRGPDGDNGGPAPPTPAARATPPGPASAATGPESLYDEGVKTLISGAGGYAPFGLGTLAGSLAAAIPGTDAGAVAAAPDPARPIRGAAGGDLDIATEMVMLIEDGPGLQTGACYEVSWDNFLQACKRLGCKTEVDPRLGEVPFIMGDSGRVSPSTIHNIWGSLSYKLTWQNIPEAYRGRGAPGALYYAGLADGGIKTADGKWPEGLRPGALVQLWEDRATMGRVAVGGSEEPGHSLVFLGYAGDGKAHISDQISRRRVAGIPYLGLGFVVAANVSAAEFAD